MERINQNSGGKIAIETGILRNLMMLSREDKVRTPAKGLRVKLRNLLRSVGFSGKFYIDHHRRLGLLVRYHQQQELPDITEFEGYPVQFEFREKGE